MFQTTRRSFFGQAAGSLAVIAAAPDESPTDRVVRLAREYDRAAAVAEKAGDDDPDLQLYLVVGDIAAELIEAIGDLPTNDTSGADGRAVVVGRKLYTVGPDHGHGSDRLSVFDVGRIHRPR